MTTKTEINILADNIVQVLTEHTANPYEGFHVLAMVIGSIVYVCDPNRQGMLHDSIYLTKSGECIKITMDSKFITPEEVAELCKRADVTVVYDNVDKKN